MTGTVCAIGLMPVGRLEAASVPSVEQPSRFDAEQPRVLVEAALVAGGTYAHTQTTTLLERFDALVVELRSSFGQATTVQERVSTIHDFLHRRVLTGRYETNASDLAETLKHGRYNCVTASVLFVAFARSCNLSAIAVQLPEHVRCEVLMDGTAMAVETTSRSAFTTSSGGMSRSLTDQQLIATIYYNRGVAAFDAGDLERSTELNQIALELDPRCLPARENLLAAINNRVVAMLRVGQLAAAARLLDWGDQFGPGYEPFRVNRAILDEKSALR
jgi:hypothetical protein